MTSQFTCTDPSLLKLMVISTVMNDFKSPVLVNRGVRRITSRCDIHPIPHPSVLPHSFFNDSETLYAVLTHVTQVQVTSGSGIGVASSGRPWSTMYIDRIATIHYSSASP